MANANDTGLLILAGIAALGLAFRPRGAGWPWGYRIAAAIA